MKELSGKQKIILLLFKDFLKSYNSRSISKVIGISHAGAFKILKKLERDNLVVSEKIGQAVVYSLNFDNSLVSREVEISLIIESQHYNRWIEEFKNLNHQIEFAILFGSVLKNEKTARDIDLLIVADKGRFIEIKKLISERSKFLNKKIHLIFQTLEDFEGDIKNRNEALVEMVGKGVVLFGQENIRKVLEVLR